MALNTLAAASKYASELDKALVQSAATGFLADNVFRTKFVGAKTVLIPDIDFVGLADYDRDTGYAKSGITVSQTSFTLSKDRGRQLQLDREDMDETGISSLAGKILGEYVRTKVVPEMDAYVISKLAGVAKTKSHTQTYSASTVFKQLMTAQNNVCSRAGFTDELVAFVDPTFYFALMNSEEVSRHITVSDFKKGDASMQVKSLNGMAIIPVSAERMRGAYTFNAGTAATAGGFEPAAKADYVRALVLPKKGASLVKKTETMRIFTPEQNLDADAYVFDYRLYYDVFVKKSGMDNIESIVEASAT